ncbi:MAG: RES family NAD+ phosphorylase [Desulfohalobiaceae bacterium]|nr:RES family NAD+ phosphorylase [Desulfohalobiaceae bacterium]
MPEMRGWRLVKTKRKDSAFDGKGAGLFGGRWNRKGEWVAYATSCAGVAVLEVFVNLEISSLSDLRSIHYTIIGFTLHIPTYTRITRDQLPDGWRLDPPPKTLPMMGSQWFREEDTPALLAPSAVVPQEEIIILNPSHPQLKYDVFLEEEYIFDPRMVKGEEERG